MVGVHLNFEKQAKEMSSLVADYKSSESSDTSENDEAEYSSFKLPLPSLSDLVQTGEKFSSSNDLQKRKYNKNSVYMNPYLKAEEESLSTLLKHGPLVDVKLEEKKDKHFSKKIKKSKLCAYFFKYGSCKFTDKCKFLHSLQNQNDLENNKATIYNLAPLSKEVSKKSLNRGAKVKNIAFLENAELSISNVSNTDELTSISNVSNTDDTLWENKNIHKKRRVGLTNNILPPKRAFKAYKNSQK